MIVFPYSFVFSNSLSFRPPRQPGQHYNATSPEAIVSEYDVWYKNYSLEIKYGLDHCSANAISFHYSRFEAKRFFSLIYGLCPGN